RQRRLVQKRRRRISPHSPCVRSLVTIKRPFMVLRRRKQLCCPAIAQDMQRNFFPFQQFLDDDLLTRRPERFPNQNFINRPLRLLNIPANQHTLSQRQTVRLYGAPSKERCSEGFRRRGFLECPRSRSWNPILFHEPLSERFRSFELRRLPIRPPNPQPFP